jgi:crotonobetainyl-CoA:carnitine CoA-transferase CaiB-like acyl-CoA transferase
MPSSEHQVDDATELPLHGLPVVKPAPGPSLLGGIRVVDLTTSIAGPYASMLLGDFGAEIVKVERPEGDDARGWGPPFLDGESLWFAAVNRNKKSVVLDLGDENDRARLRRLVATADVFITNQPPSVQKKLGLDHETIRAIREDIVFTSITGFGLEGERADLTCYDLIAEGYSGVMDLTGAAGGAAQKIGAPAADMLAGQDAAMATMAALYERAQSGIGRRIDVSLVESMTRFLSCRLVSYLGSGEIPTRSGGTDSVIAIYQAFETADEPLTLGLGNDAIWRRFWEAVGDADYAARPEFSSNALRRQHRAAIVERIQGILKTAPRDRWLALFARKRVPAGPINGADAVAADAELQRRGLFYALDDNGRLVPQVGLGIRIDGAAATARSAPPALGEHSDELLSFRE